MEQVDFKTKIIVIRGSVEMKWLNEQFFGGDAHWTDYLWFYGTNAFGVLVAIILFFYAN